MPTRIFMKNQKMLRLAIGRNSLKIRKSAGYSQCEFAKAIGVSKRTYEGYERRETTMPIEVAYEIYKKFGGYVFALDEIEASMSRSRILRTNKTNIQVRPTLLLRFAQWRQDILESYLVYVRETHSSFRQKWAESRGSIFMAAATCYLYQFINLVLLSGANLTIGRSEWILIISAAVLVLFIPMEFVAHTRFWLWRHRQRNG